MLLLPGFGLTKAKADGVLLYGVSHGLLTMGSDDVIQVAPKP